MALTYCVSLTFICEIVLWAGGPAVPLVSFNEGEEPEIGGRGGGTGGGAWLIRWQHTRKRDITANDHWILFTDQYQPQNSSIVLFIRYNYKCGTLWFYNESFEK